MLRSVHRNSLIKLFPHEKIFTTNFEAEKIFAVKNSNENYVNFSLEKLDASVRIHFCSRERKNIIKI